MGLVAASRRAAAIDKELEAEARYALGPSSTGPSSVGPSSLENHHHQGSHRGDPVNDAGPMSRADVTTIAGERHLSVSQEQTRDHSDHLGYGSGSGRDLPSGPHDFCGECPPGDSAALAAANAAVTTALRRASAALLDTEASADALPRPGPVSGSGSGSDFTACVDSELPNGLECARSEALKDPQPGEPACATSPETVASLPMPLDDTYEEPTSPSQVSSRSQAWPATAPPPPARFVAIDGGYSAATPLPDQSALAEAAGTSARPAAGRTPRQVLVLRSPQVRMGSLLPSGPGDEAVCQWGLSGVSATSCLQLKSIKMFMNCL